MTLSDLITDDAGNGVDGESNAIGAIANPVFPSGDGVPGGTFVARFNVDSAVELGVFGQGGSFIDANGNATFDPTNGDLANRDMAFDFGIQTDAIFAGQFSAELSITVLIELEPMGSSTVNSAGCLISTTMEPSMPPT